MYKSLKKLILLLLCTGVLIPARGQEQVSLRSAADKLFHQQEYYRAADLYRKLTDRKKSKPEDMERLAECYYRINDYVLSRNWYSRVINEGKFSDASLLYYGDVLKKTGDYTEAKKQLESYALRTGNREEVTLAIQGADSAGIWMTNPTAHRLKNEVEVNTQYSEFAPVPLSTSVLYAGEPSTWSGNTSGRTGRPFLRIYSAARSDGLSLTYPAILPDVFNDAAYHVGPVAVSKDEQTLYVTRTHPGNDVEKQRSGRYKFKKHNLELLIYTRNGNSWTERVFEYNNVKRYSVGHAALSDDEQTLYFASDMPGGEGGVDIWYSRLQADGSWGSPENCGKEINSLGDEVFPSVFGNRLYYSSNGFPGMGGLDIFVTEGARSSFKGRRNLRFPVNSASDDFSYVVVGDSPDAFYGYISSDRSGGKGLDDIYSFAFEKPKFKILLNGLTVNKVTKEKINDVQLTLLDENGQIVSRKRSDSNAVFSFPLYARTGYRIVAEKVSFHGDSIAVPALYPQQDTIIQLTLRLQPVIEKGISFVLENIYYDLDKYNIRDDAKPILNQLVVTMRDNPGLKIELSSHTDSRATAKYNMKLSQNRAEAAVDYIVSRVIARDRIVAIGYGEN